MKVCQINIYLVVVYYSLVSFYLLLEGKCFNKFCSFYASEQAPGDLRNKACEKLSLSKRGFKQQNISATMELPLPVRMQREDNSLLFQRILLEKTNRKGMYTLQGPEQSGSFVISKFVAKSYLRKVFMILIRNSVFDRKRLNRNLKPERKDLAFMLNMMAILKSGVVVFMSKYDDNLPICKSKYQFKSA